MSWVYSRDGNTLINLDNVSRIEIAAVEREPEDEEKESHAVLIYFPDGNAEWLHAGDETSCRTFMTLLSSKVHMVKGG
jgi:hypothetical protein